MSTNSKYTPVEKKLYLAGEREALSGVEKEGLTPFEKNGQQYWLPKWLATGRVKRRLFSYYYHNHNNRPSVDIVNSAEILDMDLFLDSGAFTAFSKGAVIDIEMYAEFVKESQDLWTCCSSLDAILPDPVAGARESYKNFERLTQLGANVCPVFHVREPDEWLQRYIDEGHPYVFIGGMVPESTTWLKERLDHLFYTILTDAQGYPKTKLHGFGLTDQLLMYRYPWYSVDSSSWLMTGIFGSIVMPTENGLRKVTMSEESPDARKIKSWHYHNISSEARNVVDDFCLDHGVTSAECIENYKGRDAVNAAVFQEMEANIPQKFTAYQPSLFT